jgi:hypothetical protein
MDISELQLILENATLHIDASNKADDAVTKVKNLVKALELSVKANEIMMKELLNNNQYGNLG